ncbi:MAG: glutamine--fructose-6-phosphate transaminase (isomerizing) [Gammaproteobacteria bacterium]|jgi:glucosamine--fructose-6-phosphate aminotransferase (isomerizing)|nr:glutamine--fructose-6-phosphate transaminase (isomerizing) [Gammaproteobacteria bacterium]
MCGIVGGIAQREIEPILMEGLRRLEYRGYDSAGIAVLHDHVLNRVRRQGKVSELAGALTATPLPGRLGIAHTRWATHGVPSESNAHPHFGGEGRVAVVHNGIIENHAEIRQRLERNGVQFTSNTDSEVIAHLIVSHLETGMGLVEATQKTVAELEGSYAIGVLDREDPQRLVAARHGSPLVVGIGLGEHFIASDVQALQPVTQRFVYLENGDIADLKISSVEIRDQDGNPVERSARVLELSADASERGRYRHFMLKEIFEQPVAITDTLEDRIEGDRVPDEILGPSAARILDKVNAIQIVACGTSFHAGLIGKYWFESLTGIPCHVEVASEFRYRKHVVQPGTLFVSVSQSGETADTLAALSQIAETAGYAGSLTICNVPESSLVRASDLALMTHAGPEIGVASTKAFTTQLIALLLLLLVLGRRHGITPDTEQALISELRTLPSQIERVLSMDSKIAAMAERFVDKRHTLFLGRGSHYPVAMEGALKLKEISYIHAEAYAAGELKHGPLALVDSDMPVVAVAPNDALLEKLKSNLEEVRSRGGELYVFADIDTELVADPNVHVMHVAPTHEVVAPLIFTVPLQLLAYHTAVLKGTDVDQPRNLAKSVTVE